MITIPKCYYHKTITTFIEHLIEYSGKHSFDSLDESDQETLTTLCMDRLAEDSYSVLINGDELDKTLLHLKKFLLTASMDEGYELLSSLRTNAVQSVSAHMNALFDEIVSSNYRVRMQDSGFIPFSNDQTGETEWRRSA